MTTLSEAEKQKIYRDRFYKKLRADPARYKAFKEKNNINTKKWQAAHPEKRIESARKWQANNKEKHNATVKRYIANNPIRARKLRSEASLRWAKRHPAQFQLYQRRYRERNREKINARHLAMYYAKKQNKKSGR